MSMISMLRLFGRTAHALSFVLIVMMAAALTAYTALCAFGMAPWLTASVQFDSIDVPQAGIWLQCGMTALVVALMFFAPMNSRIMALEKSHRDFHISMDDVARAYHVAHTADRAGVFTMSSEFDSMREKLSFLRDHPDLAGLENDLLTVAAQMAHHARHLADVYSDEKVDRAREFLRQRQTEAEAQQARILDAMHICREIRQWAKQVSTEEGIVAKQLAALDEQLQAALPVLGYSVEMDPTSNVVALPSKPASQ